MPQHMVTYIDRITVAKVEQLIRTCESLKKQNANEKAIKVRLFMLAANLKLNLTSDIIDFMLATKSISEAQLFDKLQNQDKQYPAPNKLIYAFHMILAAIGHYHYFVPAVSSAIARTKQLPPLIKNVLQSALYPSMLFLIPRAAITQPTHHIIGKVTGVDNTLFTLMLILGDFFDHYVYNFSDHMPIEVVEQGYLTLFKHYGHQLLLGIGVAHFLNQLVPDAVYESAHEFFHEMNNIDDDKTPLEDVPTPVQESPSFFECAERFFEEMHGMPEEPEEENMLTIGAAAKSSIGWGYDLLRQGASNVMPSGVTSAISHRFGS